MNLLNNKNLKWKHYKDDKNFDFPIDYSDAVLDARDDGRLEILVKWAPNSFCHFHRHTCLLYTSPSPRDKRQSRMPSSA